MSSFGVSRSLEARNRKPIQNNWFLLVFLSGCGLLLCKVVYVKNSLKAYGQGKSTGDARRAHRAFQLIHSEHTLRQHSFGLPHVRVVIDFVDEHIVAKLHHRLDRCVENG